MERKNDILKEAKKRYPDSEGHDCWGKSESYTDDRLFGFIAGAEWADSHISDEQIEKFMNLFYAVNREIRTDILRNKAMGSAEERHLRQIKYIKEHWNETN